MYLGCLVCGLSTKYCRATMVGRDSIRKAQKAFSEVQLLWHVSHRSI